MGPIFLLIGAALSAEPGNTGAFGAPVGSAPPGYRVEWICDITRKWTGSEASGSLTPRARWVRIHVWYPATPGTGATMTLRDYFDSPAPPGVPADLAAAIRSNDLGTPSYSFRGIYRGDEAAFSRALETRMAARNGAEPARGTFPVVVYATGQNDFTQDAVLLGEFLASCGYVVVTVPHLGTGPRRALLFVHDPLSYETQLRDLEVALQTALKLPFADGARVAAVGHSYGGIYALLLAMRGPLVRGVVGLDPTYVARRAPYELDLRKLPYFDPDLRLPIVTLRRGSGDVDRTLIDGFHRSDRLEIVFPGLLHGDFTTVAFLRRDLPDALQIREELEVRSPERAAAGASSVFRQVEASLARILSDQPIEGGLAPEDATKRSVRFTAACRVPTSEELYWILVRKGLDAARATAASARSTCPGVPVFEEARCLTIARELGYAGKESESLDMFRLVATLFPESSSAQLAAAEALSEAGKSDEARKRFEDALRLDPGNRKAAEGLNKLRG
ncbi:MAG TPA: alpha/beta fold hydrolase [Thermoanaerobaculia bacterium]|nr:alpha/beta fold hydrolase [Thermoanaerobaculia bacterium]